MTLAQGGARFVRTGRYNLAGAAPLVGALQDLLHGLQLSPAALGTIRVLGDDPHFEGPHRLAGALAVAMAAAAASSAALGTARGLPVQKLDVDVGEAARHLFPQANWAPTLNGHPLPVEHHAHRALLLGIYRTQDGESFVPCALSPRERAGWARLLRCTADAAGIAAAVAAHDGAELERLAAAADLAGTLCRTPEAWAAHPHGRHLARRAVVDTQILGPATYAQAAAGTRRWPKPAAARRPLAGLRVLVFGRAFAGPLVGRTLAEQGAQVLHVGNPAAPEPPAVYAEGFVGGRSAAADLRDPKHRRRVRALVAEADVVVDNGRAGVAAAFGLHAAALHEIRSGLVHVRIDAFGDDGPWGGRPGYDMNACAAAGLMQQQASGPARHVASVLLCDFVAAFLAAAGACAALARNVRSPEPPRGHQVTVNLARVASWCLALGPAPGAGRGPVICPVPRARTYTTPLGLLRRLQPAVDFGVTPSCWAEPVLDHQGKAELAWLADDTLLALF